MSPSGLSGLKRHELDSDDLGDTQREVVYPIGLTLLMADKYQVHLNFLPPIGEIPAFTVYRRQRENQEKKADVDVRGFKMPIETGSDHYAPFWVRLAPSSDYTPVITHAHVNVHLTCWALYESLRSQASAQLKSDEFDSDYDRFLHEIAFVMRQHAEGNELFIVRPYYLNERREFGLLVDFRFQLGKGIPFSRRIQQLSLSLNAAGKRNIDYYLDRSQKITAYVQERLAVLSPIQLPGATANTHFAADFAPLPASRLRSKVYVFGNDRSGRSQFNGLRDYGPLKALDKPPKLLFAFREQDRHVARTMAQAIKGPKRRDRYGFPGFEALFRTQFTIDSNPIVLPDLSTQSYSSALDRVKADRAVEEGVVPIFVVPEGDDNGYMDQKAIFANAGIPTQVCTLPVVQDDYSLKWAIGNVALQIFCKAGGYPWKVQPTAEQSLIIGISQSHKLRRTESATQVEKYFAFSVMTDNSGLFQRIEVLGESGDESNYLAQLQRNLSQIIADESSRFNRVVIHTSFKLKYREIEAIQKTVELASKNSADKTRFAVVKVNHHSRFFGVNRGVNCLVPFEATKVRLGAGQYLLWFEGIFPDKPTVTKLFPGPTHLEFLKCQQAATISDDELLQDLVNLSGANWRGFNAKSAPVSVFYCHLIADLVHEFHARGLPLPAVTELRPWFL